MLLHKVTSLVSAPVTLDAFARHQSCVCPRYASRLCEPEALASDGLALDWRHEVVWLNPPWALLPDVIGKLAVEQSVGVLIIPYWTTQTWWPSLLVLGGRQLNLPPPPFSVDPLHPVTLARWIIFCTQIFVSAQSSFAGRLSPGPSSLGCECLRQASARAP